MRDRPTPEGEVATGGETFADFARSRWADLEPVAQLVVLDPAVARDVTTTALARLAGDWSRALEEGRPVEEARRLVLRAALERARPRAPGTGSASPAGPVPGSDGDEADADPVRAALARHVRGLDPLARALVATDHLWGADAHEVAVLLDRPSADVRAAGARVRLGLEMAHAAARTAAGEEPAAWALEHDLRGAVERLLGDLAADGPPPDPAELVGRRTRRLRRRTLLVGGAAVAGAAGVATAVALRGGPPSPTARPLPAATDRVWFSSSLWPARGPLADDPSLRTFRSRRLQPTDRVLWAGDAGTRRVVVVAPLGALGTGMNPVRLFSGPRGAALTTLSELQPEWGYGEASDVVATAVPDGPDLAGADTVLIVLAKPTDTTAEVSRFVRPTAAGETTRTWTDLPLRDGVAVTVLTGPLTPSLRVRLGSLDTPPFSPLSPFRDLEELDRGRPVDGIEEFVTSVTGIPSSRLTTTLVSDDAVPKGLFDDLSGPSRTDARVRRYVTLTPDGAVLRTALLLDSTQVHPIELATLVPADDRDGPSIAWGADSGDGRARYLVLHQVAATVQLVALGGAVRSAVVPTKGARATVVGIDGAQDVGEFEIVLRDARGREIHRGMQVQSRWLVGG